MLIGNYILAMTFVFLQFFPSLAGYVKETDNIYVSVLTMFYTLPVELNGVSKKAVCECVRASFMKCTNIYIYIYIYIYI